MKIQEQTKGAVLVLKPSGPLVAAEAAPFRERALAAAQQTFGRIVVDATAIAYVDRRALAQQKSSGAMLGEILVEQGTIPASVLVQTLSRTLGVKGCVLRHGLIDGSLLALIGEVEAERLTVIPLFKVRDTLTVAMADP